MGLLWEAASIASRAPEPLGHYPAVAHAIALAIAIAIAIAIATVARRRSQRPSTIAALAAMPAAPAAGGASSISATRWSMSPAEAWLRKEICIT